MKIYTQSFVLHHLTTHSLIFKLMTSKPVFFLLSQNLFLRKRTNQDNHLLHRRHLIFHHPTILLLNSHHMPPLSGTWKHEFHSKRMTLPLLVMLNGPSIMLFTTCG